METISYGRYSKVKAGYDFDETEKKIALKIFLQKQVESATADENEKKAIADEHEKLLKAQQNEIEIHQKLKHDNIVNILGSGKGQLTKNDMT